MEVASQRASSVSLAGSLPCPTGQQDAGGALMSALDEMIRAHIERDGPLPFAQFMSLALYHPQHGYYSRARGQIGRRGDFITSVSVGPMFGELLAFQFARWFEREREQESKFQIVESGAHDGQLAFDILEAMENQESVLFPRVEYWIVEPSPARRAAQQAKLVRFQNVRWHDVLADLRQRVQGVIFSNELLDALPVHPFAWNASARRWEEMAVTQRGAAFIWTRLAHPNPSHPQLPDALLDVLPDGYVMELCPAATSWWREAAASLVSGRLMTIDYGGVLEELLSPARNTGTLRAYSRHSISADVLANPGEQDITAHVNFTEIINTGEAAGLKTELFTTQCQFLTEIARVVWKGNDFLPPQKIRQFQTLTHPEHLGRPFKVLVQSRAAGKRD